MTAHVFDRLHERVNAATADTAFELLREPRDLVLLVTLAFPAAPAPERIALPLTGADRPPHLIITRDGRGVTCLAEGMTTDCPTAPYPLVSRLLRERAAALRAARAGARLDSDDDLASTYEGIVRRGYRYTRADVERLRVVAPLLTTVLLDSVQMLVECGVKWATTPRRRPFPPNADAIRSVWRVLTATSLMLMVSASDPEISRVALLAMFTRIPMLTGRGLWVLTQYPERTLGFLEPAVRQKRPSPCRWAVPILFCIAARFPWLRAAALRLQAEAQRVAEATASPASPWEPALLHQLVIPTWAALALEAPMPPPEHLPDEEGVATPVARHAEEVEVQAAILARLEGQPAAQAWWVERDLWGGAMLPPSTNRLPAVGAMPPVSRRVELQRWLAGSLAVDHPVTPEVSLLWSVFLFDALVPGTQMDPWWSMAAGARVLSSIDDMMRVPAAPPAAAKAQGRNDRCACGSGKKFKHCCGA